MKLAYLANIRFPSERAHSIQISQMCEAFSKQCSEVVLYVNTRVIDERANVGASYVVKRLPYGIFLTHIKLSYYISELFFATAFLFLKERNDFDIIYSRHEWIVWFLSLFIQSEKLVWESHEAKLNFAARNVLKKGVRTVVISEGILEDYLRFGIDKKNVLVAHDGIDQSFFKSIETKQEARQRLGLSVEDTIALYIGGFDGWKGIETFFSAAAFVPEARFVAVGGRPEQVSTFSKKYPGILFLGQLPYADLKNNQQAADVLIIPNSGKTELSARYTSPLKLFAHMASGVPIVASDIPSLVTVTGRELVTLVPADSNKALAEGIQSVLADYNNKTLRAQELKNISLGYTWDYRSKSIINFISH